MLQPRRHTKGATTTTPRLARLLGPEALEERALLSATAAASALQLPALTVSSAQYSLSLIHY